MNSQELHTQLKALDTEWERLSREHRAAIAADEVELLAGRLNKNVYIEQDKARLSKFYNAQSQLTEQAQALVKAWVVRFKDLPEGAYFSLLHDRIFNITYRKIEPTDFCNALDLATGRLYWIADTVSVVKAELEVSNEQPA